MGQGRAIPGWTYVGERFLTLVLIGLAQLTRSRLTNAAGVVGGKAVARMVAGGNSKLPA